MLGDSPELHHWTTESILPEKRDGNAVYPVLFFDNCMPHLEECREGCQSDRSYYCKHRLKFEPEAIFHADGRQNFLGYSDQQVVLYFLFLIKQKYGRADLSNRRFIIVTKDELFLHDARAEHSKPRKNWKKPRLEFNNEYVKAEGMKIHVRPVDCAKCVKAGTKEIRCAINQLNRFWSRVAKIRHN